ncbi:MAG: outer membrane beta-barrel protein [Bacteroidia bacterium]
MKKSLYLILFLLTTNSIWGQLTNGHWLVGGSARFNSYKNEIFSNSYNENGKYTQIDLSPNVGYFFADRFALGLKTTFTSIKGEYTVAGGNGRGGSDNQRYLFGAFARYYFLEEAKQTNLLVEASYQAGIIRGTNNTKGNLNNFSISAGPVIYFNPSVGIEFLLGYVTNSEKYTSQVLSENKKGFQLSIGLQIHLIK